MYAQFADSTHIHLHTHTHTDQHTQTQMATHKITRVLLLITCRAPTIVKKMVLGPITADTNRTNW